jgi:protein-tyrosine-phosphatase
LHWVWCQQFLALSNHQNPCLGLTQDLDSNAGPVSVAVPWLGTKRKDDKGGCTVQRLLVFVCIGNRNRSPFAEFFFSKLISERDKELAPEIRLWSCGFIPQQVKEKIAAFQIGFPDPFFGRPLALSTRAVLLKEGIAVPEGWRTKPLTPEVVKESDMIITVLSEQKMELIDLYPEAAAKIFSIRELSQWDGHLSWDEDLKYKRIPSDIDFWDYVEENMDHVSMALSEMKKMLIMAYSDILDKLGLTHAESKYE